MCPTIEISDELYKKLSDLAVGFDTPESVITRLAEASQSTPVPLVESEPPTPPSDPRSFVEAAFEKVFKVSPRPFGANAGKWVGASDDNNGVQWNIALSRSTGETYLGVNLEGMKYKNWPITNLLLNESKNPKLSSLASLPHADEINVNLTRDAWQAAARPLIEEKHIEGSEASLSDMSVTRWESMVADALFCLNPAVGYRGRGTMEVTLVRSGDVVKKQVSPHLTLRTLVWDAQPESFDEAVSLIADARSKLLPIHTWMSGRSEREL